MAKLDTIKAAIPPDIAQAVREAVAAGEYVSECEVVRAALREWHHQRQQDERALDELRGLIQEGIDSGEPVDGEQAMADILAELEQDYGTRAAE